MCLNRWLPTKSEEAKFDKRGKSNFLNVSLRTKILNKVSEIDIEFGVTMVHGLSSHKNRFKFSTSYLLYDVNMYICVITINKCWIF